MEAYARIIPDFAERYMRVWEGEVRHRQGLETKGLDKAISHGKLGIWLGFSLNLLCYGLAVILALLKVDGASLAAVIVAGLSSIGLFTNTVKARQK